MCYTRPSQSQIWSHSERVVGVRRLPHPLLLCLLLSRPGQLDRGTLQLADLILDPQGQNYQYRDTSAPVLGRSDDEQIALKLPSNMKVGDLKWISVWCRRFTVDFGNLIFPDNLDLPTSEKQLPHPLVPVDGNDVSGEPEPESEGEPEPGRSQSESDPDIVFNPIFVFRTRPRPPRPP